MVNKKPAKPVKVPLTPEQIHAKIIERQANKVQAEMNAALEQIKRENQ